MRHCIDGDDHDQCRRLYGTGRCAANKNHCRGKYKQMTLNWKLCAQRKYARIANTNSKYTYEPTNELTHALTECSSSTCTRTHAADSTSSKTNTYNAGDNVTYDFTITLLTWMCAKQCKALSRKFKCKTSYSSSHSTELSGWGRSSYFYEFTTSATAIRALNEMTPFTFEFK